MTPTKPDDFRDPQFDAAWRAVSREEPSPALDDAIRAAARREAGAGPRRAEAIRPPSRVPEATRPERWWWPLAAAATIGAIAFGLLQLRPLENGGGGTVSDMPGAATPRTLTEPTKTPEAPAPSSAASRESTAAATDDASLARKETAQPPVEGRAATPGGNARRSAAPPPPPPPPGVREPAQLAQPFPAPKAELPEAVRTDAPPSTATSAPTPTPLATGAGERASAPATGLASGARDQLPRPAPQAARVGKMPGEAPAALAPRLDVGAQLPAADWIALIRRLRDEGRNDEAAKELAAFRDAYPDHQQRLPPDLRDWRAPEK